MAAGLCCRRQLLIEERWGKVRTREGGPVEKVRASSGDRGSNTLASRMIAHEQKKLMERRKTGGKKPESLHRRSSATEDGKLIRGTRRVGKRTSPKKTSTQVGKKEKRGRVPMGEGLWGVSTENQLLAKDHH